MKIVRMKKNVYMFSKSCVAFGPSNYLNAKKIPLEYEIHNVA